MSLLIGDENVVFVAKPNRFWGIRLFFFLSPRTDVSRRLPTKFPLENWEKVEEADEIGRIQWRSTWGKWSGRPKLGGSNVSSVWLVTQSVVLCCVSSVGRVGSKSATVSSGTTVKIRPRRDPWTGGPVVFLLREMFSFSNSRGRTFFRSFRLVPCQWKTLTVTFFFCLHNVSAAFTRLVGTLTGWDSGDSGTSSDCTQLPQLRADDEISQRDRSKSFGFCHVVQCGKICRT